MLRSEIAFPRGGVIIFERLIKLIGNGKIIKKKNKTLTHTLQQATQKTNTGKGGRKFFSALLGSSG